MSNLSKNLLLGLTVICIIAVVVFCIQLIVINSGVDRTQPGSISGGSGQNDGENGDGSTDGEDGDDEGSGAAPVTTPRPSPQGTRYELMIADNSRLIVYARDEYFDFEEGDLKWLFNYIGGGTAGLEIAFTMLTAAQGADAQAEAFLNRYAGSAGAEFTREEVIHDSGVYGYHAFLYSDNENFEVWIHNLVGSDIALAFIIKYENNQQKEALYEVLSTLDILMVGDLVTPPPDHGDAGDGTGIGTGIADGADGGDGGADGGD